MNVSAPTGMLMKLTLISRPPGTFESRSVAPADAYPSLAYGERGHAADVFIVDGQRWFDAFDNAIAEISERSANTIKVVFKEQAIDSYISEFGVRSVQPRAKFSRRTTR